MNDDESKYRQAAQGPIGRACRVCKGRAEAREGSKLCRTCLRDAAGWHDFIAQEEANAAADGLSPEDRAKLERWVEDAKAKLVTPDEAFKRFTGSLGKPDRCACPNPKMQHEDDCPEFWPGGLGKDKPMGKVEP